VRFLDFNNEEVFNNLKKLMGIDETVPLEVTFNWEEPLGGIEIEDINDINVNSDDNTLEFQGRKVIVYIRDQIYNERYPNREYKFHVAWCQTLSKMAEGNRFKSRYVAKRKNDNIFIVNIFDRGVPKKEGNEREKGKRISMNVCKNCLDAINYQDYFYSTKSERDDIYNKFTMDEYFKEYDSKIFNVPPHNEITAPINTYPDNWDEISKTYKEMKDWKCEECGKNLQNNKSQLQTHHIDGDKSNCRKDNLLALCKECHKKQFLH